MKQYKNHTLKEYLDVLSFKTPVPGGGSAAALVGALAVGLIAMVTNYSLGRNHSTEIEKKFKAILKKAQILKKKLLNMVDLDAQAYLKVVKTRRANERIKKAARLRARQVPQEVSRLCYEALLLTPFLIEKGNPYLRSDVQVAVEFLQAAFKAARFNVDANQ